MNFYQASEELSAIYVNNDFYSQSILSTYNFSKYVKLKRKDYLVKRI